MNNPKTVGIFRLTAKTNSDNFRYSAVESIIKTLLENNINVIIYEPLIKEKVFNGINIVNE